MLNANEFDGVLILLESATNDQLDFIIEKVADMYHDRHM